MEMKLMSLKAAALPFCNIPAGGIPISFLDKQNKGKDKVYYKEIKWWNYETWEEILRTPHQIILEPADQTIVPANTLPFSSSYI